MIKDKFQAVFLIAVSLYIAVFPLGADTWRLDESRQWKEVSKEGKDKFLAEVSEAKNFVNKGETKKAQQAFDNLRKDYPEIAGPDLNAFIKAEMYLCQGKLEKAGNAYQKFLSDYPRSGLYDAAMERQFSIANAYLNGQKKPVLLVFKIKGYDEGEKMMDRIVDRAGDAPIAISAARTVAESQEKRGKFSDAYLEWSKVSNRWGTGQIGKDALLGMGRCKHAGYKGPKYDASGLISAETYYENFESRYPQDANIFGIGDKIKQIKEQKAYKEFSIGQYYQKTGNVQAANLYFEMIGNEWPNSTAAKMIGKAIEENKKILEKEKKWKALKKIGKLLL